MSSNAEQLQENNENLNNIRSSLSSLPTATQVAQQHEDMLSDLAEIKSAVSSGVAKESTSQEILSKLESGGSSGVVKHIQKGTGVITASETGTTAPCYAEVALSGFTNLDKMVVFVSGTGMASTNYGVILSPLIPLVVALDKLVITDSMGGSFVVTTNSYYTYQVIEFY